MIERRRFKQTAIFVEWLLCDKQHLREQADELPLGAALDKANRKSRCDETAARISEWLDSPGLRVSE